MKSRYCFFEIALIMVISVIGCSDSKYITPPKAEKIKKELTIHGDTRIDNYYWLKNRDDQKVINYLIAENEYTKKSMTNTEKVQEQLYNEMIGRIKQNDETVPYTFNGYYYYEKYEPGKEYPIYCRKKESLNNNEEVILDVNEISKGKNFVSIRGRQISPDNKILAYGIDFVSRRRYSIQFKNLETGKLLSDELINTNGLIAWANDNKTIFYTIKDETLRPFKILKHILGDDLANDVEVYHESDSTFNCYVNKSKSQKFIMINCESMLSTECRFIDADNPYGKFKIIQERMKNLEYYPVHYRNEFYIRTNDNAKNFKIVSAPVNSSSKEYWNDLIPKRDDILVEDIEVFKKFYVINERHNGLSKLRVKDWAGKVDCFIEFDDPTYEVYMSDNYEIDTPNLRLIYNSLTTPKSTYDYDMNKKEKTLLKTEEVGGEFNKGDYISERKFATAKDGIKVPISLVYKRELKKEHGNPLLLYGYGSYGYSCDADFRSFRLSLLDRGFIFAIAHIRGGKEMGYWWYEDGKLLKKKNTFTDFIACAEYLVKEKYTSQSMLFAQGGSAGGLLMAAVVNIRPDIFRGVIANVPWVDVITTMLDPNIPLTSVEYDEWGDPNKKEHYDYMLSYSPYDQVRKQNYPSLLVTTGLHDSQVQYWEPVKWVAKLRHLKTDQNTLLLKIDMESGHGGASGRYKKYRETALEYAFIFDQIGIKE